MKRFAAILLFGLLFVLGFAAIPAHAQYTLVSGTVVDPNGFNYAHGTINAKLIPVISGAYQLNGQTYTGTLVNTNLDDTGSFTAVMGSNGSILPAGSSWQFTVCGSSPVILQPLGTGTQCFTATATINGGTQNISSTLNAAAPILSNLCLIGQSCGAGGTPAGMPTNLQYNLDGTHFGASTFNDFEGSCPGDYAATSSACIQAIDSGTTSAVTIGTDEISVGFPSPAFAFTSITPGNILLVDTSNHVAMSLDYGGTLVLGAGDGIDNGLIRFVGSVSGSADIRAANIAGNPNPIILPIATGLQGQLLTTDGNSPSQQLSWTSTILAFAINTGTTSPTDFSGTLTSVANAFTYTFAGGYADPPNCVVQDRTAIASLLTVTITNSTLAGTTTGATDSVSYVCSGTI